MMNQSSGCLCSMKFCNSFMFFSPVALVVLVDHRLHIFLGQKCSRNVVVRRVEPSLVQLLFYGHIGVLYTVSPFEPDHPSKDGYESRSCYVLDTFLFQDLYELIFCHISLSKASSCRDRFRARDATSFHHTEKPTDLRF